MAGDAVPQAQELPQERFLDRAEQRHVRAILAAGQYGAERDQQQFMQIMAGIILPGGQDLGKAGDEFFHGRASTLNPRLESSHASPSNPRLQPPAPYAIALAIASGSFGSRLFEDGERLVAMFGEVLLAVDRTVPPASMDGEGGVSQ